MTDPLLERVEAIVEDHERGVLDEGTLEWLAQARFVTFDVVCGEAWELSEPIGDIK